MDQIENDPSHHDYAIAQLLTAELSANGAVYPRWIDDDHFWYERRDPGNRDVSYRVVHAPTGEGRTIFTRAAVAKALADHLRASVDPEGLLLARLTVDLQGGAAWFSALGASYEYRFACATVAPATHWLEPGWLRSPDGKSAVFVKDHNVWVRDLQGGGERALTTYGSECCAYAELPLCKRRLHREPAFPPAPEGCWSPDSRRFFTLQVDERHIADLPLVDFAPADAVRPRILGNRTSLPGDERVSEFRLICIEVSTARETPARYRRVPAARMSDTPFSAGLAWWSTDNRTAYFVHVERGDKAAHVIAFDVIDGSIRTILSERSDTYVELSVNVTAPALLRPLPQSDELIWYSERLGRGHLYLYDLATGALKAEITRGPWQVREIQHVDAARREVFFTAAGIAEDEDPYLCKPCIASLDGGPVRVLSSEPGDHIVWRPGEFDLALVGMQGVDKWTISGVSPQGSYFVETVAAVDRLPRTVLRRRDGELVAVLEQATARMPEGWTWPLAVKLKASDGATDVYGLLFMPWRYDRSETYPIIDYIYGGPQYNNVPKSVFALGRSLAHGDTQYFEAAQLAALGAFVLMLDGRGTAHRERAFREASYGAMQTASNLEDHIAAIRQLAISFPAIDLQRVGVCGFSAGGYMSVLAALRHGDFFKVAVAGSGNYDQALFWHCWGERYHGPFDTDLYTAQAAKTYAHGLKGKLLLIHGMMDSACHPAGLFQLVQALIDANKDFDLVLLPRAGHDLTAYGVRRRMDYFVTHLFRSKAQHAVSTAAGSSRLGEAAAGGRHRRSRTTRFR